MFRAVHRKGLKPTDPRQDGLIRRCLSGGARNIRAPLVLLRSSEKKAVAEPPIKDIVGQTSWRPINNSGIEYDTTKLTSMPASLAETDGYKEHLSEEEGWVVERTYFCQWADAANAMQWLRGYSRATPSGISRITPAQDPYRPWLYCMRAELVEPMGVALQDPGLTFSETLVSEGDGVTEEVATKYIPGTVWAEKQYQDGDRFSDGMAKIRATFRGVPYVIRNDTQQALLEQQELAGELGRYTERRPRYAIQGIPLINIARNGQLIFVGSKTPQTPKGILVPEAGVLLMPTASWLYTWHDVPFHPSAAILACQGRVNLKPFDGLVGFPAFPAQTILCQAPEIHTKRNASGAVSFDVTWTLDFRPEGWNSFPTANATFALATFGGDPPAPDGSNLVFKPADFGLLFAPGPPIFFA